MVIVVVILKMLMEVILYVKPILLVIIANVHQDLPMLTQVITQNAESLERVLSLVKKHVVFLLTVHMLVVHVVVTLLRTLWQQLMAIVFVVLDI